MHRYGSVIKLKSDKLDEYKELHENVWPTVLEKIKECNIRNYSIFYKDGVLFSYFEYVGDDFDADMLSMADDPNTQAWWELTDPCQDPFETRKAGEQWASMEEFFHTD